MRRAKIIYLKSEYHGIPFGDNFPPPLFLSSTRTLDVNVIGISKSIHTVL